MDMQVAAAIVGTAVAVAGAMGAAGLFVLRLVIAQDIAPIGKEMGELRITLGNAIHKLDEHRMTSQKGEHELHAILDDLRRIVGDHETRITVLEVKA